MRRALALDDDGRTTTTIGVLVSIFLGGFSPITTPWHSPPRPRKKPHHGAHKYLAHRPATAVGAPRWRSADARGRIDARASTSTTRDIEWRARGIFTTYIHSYIARTRVGV